LPSIELSGWTEDRQRRFGEVVVKRPGRWRIIGCVRALANVVLWKSDKAFSLPADRTPSMLFRFGGPQGVLIGASATDPVGVRFSPGTEHHDVRLEFWADEPAAEIVAVGAAFDVWYGGDIGLGQIIALM
jgi:hypothetical protein